MRTAVMMLLLMTGAVAQGASLPIELLGSWTLYRDPGFLSGTSSSELSGLGLTGLGVRVAFGPESGSLSGLDLFEELVVVQGDADRVVAADITTDPDFGAIASLLTNGNTNDEVFVETREFHASDSGSSSGAPWTEDYWAQLPNSTGHADFSGYSIARIDMVVELVSWVSPGRDLNRDGDWTDYVIDTRLDFYGTLIPEPTTATLLILAVISTAKRRR